MLYYNILTQEQMQFFYGYSFIAQWSKHVSAVHVAILQGSENNNKICLITPQFNNIVLVKIHVWIIK
jgi:hypothetical protein